MKTKLLSFLFLLFLLAPHFAVAQVGRLRGTVTDSDGNPIVGAQVEIRGMDIKRNYKVKTNKKGKYLHVGVALGGIYQIIVTKEGYQRDGAQGARATSDHLSEKLGVYDFVLRPIQQGQSERKLAFELSDEERARMEKLRAEQEKQKANSAKLSKDFREAQNLLDAGSFEEALALLNDAAKLDATQPAVWISMAKAEEGLGNHEKAIAAYEKAAMLQPDAAIYQNMGNLYAALKDSEKAQQYYDKAVELSAGSDPSVAAATYYNMAVGHINAQDTEKAKEALRKALDADPGYAEAHYQLGIILTNDMDAIPQAVEHFKKYLELAPQGPNAESAKLLVEGLSG